MPEGLEDEERDQGDELTQPNAQGEELRLLEVLHVGERDGAGEIEPSPCREETEEWKDPDQVPRVKAGRQQHEVRAHHEIPAPQNICVLPPAGEGEGQAPEEGGDEEGRPRAGGGGGGGAGKG